MKRQNLKDSKLIGTHTWREVRGNTATWETTRTGESERSGIEERKQDKRVCTQLEGGTSEIRRGQHPQVTELVAEMVLRGARTLIEPSQIYSPPLSWLGLSFIGVGPFLELCTFCNCLLARFMALLSGKSLINLVSDMPCPPLAPAMFDIQ